MLPQVAVTALSGKPTECSYLQKKQLEDEIIGFILKAKETQQNLNAQLFKAKPRETQQLSQLWDQLIVQEGILYRRFDEGSGRG